MIKIEKLVTPRGYTQCNCCNNTASTKDLFNIEFYLGANPLIIKLCEDCMNQLHDLIEDTRPTYLTFD